MKFTDSLREARLLDFSLRSKPIGVGPGLAEDEVILLDRGGALR